MRQKNSLILQTCAIIVFACAIIVGCRTPQVVPNTTVEPVEPIAVSVDTLTATSDTIVADTATTDLQQRLQALLDVPLLERSQVSMRIVDLTDSCEIFSLQPQQRIRPASCMKLLTAITALAQLGSNSPFTTTLFIEPDKTSPSTCRNIYLRGSMDALLNATNIDTLVAGLQKRGIKTISGNLVLDATMKDTLRYGKGWCWDDNNPQLTPLLYNQQPTLGQQFSQQLQKAGIRLQGKTTSGTVKSNCEMVAEISHTLLEMLLPTLRESNNLCAEAIYYHLAQSRRALRASASDAQKAETEMLQQLGFDKSHFRLADGSGLSLYNYLSADILVELLRYAYEQPPIFDALLQTLPVAGESGTLQKRMKGTSAAGNIWAKTGTLTGVSSLSGYARTPEGHTLAFAILCHGINTQAEARSFQDQICTALTQ